MNHLRVAKWVGVYLILIVSSCASQSSQQGSSASKVVKTEASNSMQVSEKPKEEKASAVDPLSDIKRIFNRFWTSDSVTMKLNKILESTIVESPPKYFGTFYFSKGKIRVEFIKPKKSLLVVDDDFIWHAAEIPKELGGNWQVSKIKKSLRSSSQAFLNLMFGDELYWKKLKLIEKKGDEYTFVPRSEADFPNLKKLQMVLSPDKTELKAIIQWDHIENKTTYLFADPDYKKLIPKKFFTFKVPKGATVNEF